MSKDLDRLQSEFLRSGRLAGASCSQLKSLIQSDSAFEAISAAADCNARELADNIARQLDSPDAMIRWIATATLLTRFRMAQYANTGLRLAMNDPSLMVRCVAIVGLGEVIASIQSSTERIAVAKFCVSVLRNPDFERGMREAAYEAILAASGIPAEKRGALVDDIDLKSGVDSSQVDGFLKRFSES